MSNRWHLGKVFHTTYVYINHMAHSLGQERSKVLIFFHTFTGCDTVSTFYDKGKQAAWTAWESFLIVARAFSSISFSPHSELEKDSETFKTLEHHVFVLYDKTNNLESVNEARKHLFCQRSRPMKNILPTQDALLQHAKWAAYQASIWETSDLCQQQTPLTWGARMNNVQGQQHLAASVDYPTNGR